MGGQIFVLKPRIVQDTLLEETKSEINDSVSGSREPQRSPEIQQKKTDEQPSRSKKNRKKKVKNNLTEKQAEMELIRSKIIQGGRNDSSPPVQTNENATTKKQPKKPAKKTEGSPTTESITQKNKTDVSQELKPNESTNGKKQAGINGNNPKIEAPKKKKKQKKKVGTKETESTPEVITQENQTGRSQDLKRNGKTK